MQATVTTHIPVEIPSKLQRLGINSVFFFSLYFICILPLYAASQQKEHLLPFTLVGTITGTQPLALLEFNDKKLHFYTLADKIENFTLTEIKRNKIKLSRNTQFFTLHLQQRTAVVSRPASTGIPSDSPSEQTTGLPIDIQIKRQLLNHIRHNIQQWLGAVSLKLVMTDGRVSGYSVVSVQNIPLSSAIGLQPGDIIKSINGIHVGQPRLFAKTTNNLINRNDIYIKIERGHKLNTLHFLIKD